MSKQESRTIEFSSESEQEDLEIQENSAAAMSTSRINGKFGGEDRKFSSSSQSSTPPISGAGAEDEEPEPFLPTKPFSSFRSQELLKKRRLSDFDITKKLCGVSAFYVLAFLLMMVPLFSIISLSNILAGLD